MKTLAPESLFKESFRPEPSNFIKREALAHVFSCEFCEISKNTFSYGTPQVAASEKIDLLRTEQAWL